MMEILQFAAYKIIGLIYKLFWVFPINKKKIIVNAFGGKGYCDHPASRVFLMVLEELGDMLYRKCTNMQLLK